MHMHGNLLDWELRSLGDRSKEGEIVGIGSATVGNIIKASPVGSNNGELIYLAIKSSTTTIE